MARKPSPPRISETRRKELRHAPKETRYREAVRLINRGASLRQALKNAGISRSTFKTLNERHQAVEPAPEEGRGRYRLTVKTAHAMTVVDATGQVRSVRLAGKDRQAGVVWQNSVNTLLAMRNPSRLTIDHQLRRRLMGTTIRTVDGERIRLSTDWDQIRQAVLAMTPEEQEDLDIYRDDRSAAAA
jgi:hypothetical protein